MKAEVKVITPAWAAKMLEEKNSGNRPRSRAHVEALAKEMLEGKWKVNGDTICVNGTRLIDGQHRLAAVVLSGVTIKSLVAEGVPSDVFDTKDIGKRRSAGDTLSVKGEKNSSRLAAALVQIDKYVTGRAESTVTYRNTEIEELLQKYPDARSSLRTSNPTQGIIAPSILDACYYLFSQKDPELAEDFVVKVLKGAGLEEGSPWYLLRERLIRNSLSKAKLPNSYILALCIKSWNAARTGTKIRYLRWREQGATVEAFPVVH